MGQDMQQQILPSGAPDVAGYDLAGLCTTSAHVGGDYYDFLALPDGRTMIVIADVSGHNLPSGMMMVSARTTLRLLASRETGCREIFDELASSLFSDLIKRGEEIGRAKKASGRFVRIPSGIHHLCG